MDTVNKSKLNVPYEILEKATNYFNDANKLGQGGSGSVYKVSSDLMSYYYPCGQPNCCLMLADCLTIFFLYHHRELCQMEILWLLKDLALTQHNGLIISSTRLI